MCCKDHLHCCPEGTTCNSAAGKCDRGESSVSMTWFTKTAATPVREEKTSSAVLCPDGKGTCPEGSTCCLLASGQYACCPLPKVAQWFYSFYFLFLLDLWVLSEILLKNSLLIGILIKVMQTLQYRYSGCCPQSNAVKLFYLIYFFSMSWFV